MSNFWGPFFSLFRGQKKFLNFFWKHYSVSTEKLHNTTFVKVKKTQGFLGQKIWV